MQAHMHAAHMHTHRYMNSLHREFGHAAAFAMLYVAEAHAHDEWPINSSRCNGTRGPVCINAPGTTERRVELARAFASDFAIKMPVGAMAAKCHQVPCESGMRDMHERTAHGTGVRRLCVRWLRAGIRAMANAVLHHG